MKNVLVTGGAGFIGSHLCERLLIEGYSITCLDNLLTGSEKNISHLKSNPAFHFIEADIISPVGKLPEDSVFDYIFHMASPASPVDYQKYPHETLLVNSIGTQVVLSMAIGKNTKVLVASTSEVYGDPLEHPQKETYFGNVNTFGPRACYDESKRFAETLVYVYLHKFDIDARIVRIFNTYGPNMQKDDGRVVSNFINAAIASQPLKLDGDGSQTRSFCYVSDMVDGLIKAMFTDKTSGEIFNLGNPDEFTIKELAEKIVKMTGSSSEVQNNGSFRQNDPMRRKPDITKAKEKLNWEPVINLEEGLEKTIEYYKNLDTS